MKTNKLFIAMLTVVAVLFTACKEEIPVREDSPADTDAGCYIFDNMSDITVRPADDGKYLMTMGGTTETVDAMEFDLFIGRSNGFEAVDSFELQVIDESGAFLFDPMVRFAAGEAVDTITIPIGLTFGEEATLVVTIPEEKASIYSASEKTIKVAVDYTWLPRGKAEVYCSLIDVTCTTTVEKAKEATDSLFRLTNVFEELAKELDSDDYEEFSTSGIHFKFILDPNYNIVSLVGNGGSSPTHYSNTGWLAMALAGAGVGNFEYAYSDAALANYGATLANDANKYVLLNTVIFDESGTAGYYFSLTWTWTEGFPGKMVNPSEGEGSVSEMTFSSGTVATNNGVHTITMTEGGVTMNLVLVGETVAGEYKIKAETEEPEAGTAIAGTFDGTSATGCYIDAAITKYYLTSGTVKVEEESGTYKVTVEAETATGVEVKATGTFSNSASPAPLKGCLNAKKITF